NLFQRLCDKPAEHTLPPSVTRFAQWVADSDAVLARRLLAALETADSLQIVKAARHEIDRLIHAVRVLSQNVTGTHKVALPYGTITFYIRKPTFFEKLFKSLSR